MSNQPYRILAFDGGGMRGLTSAVMIECLEKKLQKHDNNPNARLKDYFDMIAGTSTGSLIACAVAKGHSATQIKELYLKRAAEIFPKTKTTFKHLQMLKGLVSRVSIGYSQPIFDGKGLETVLKDESNVFGATLLFEELSKPTLITTYDIYNRQALVFKNTNPLLGKVPVWEVCRASSAAPIAFPAHVINNPNFIKYWEKEVPEIPAEGVPLIDGGMIANDPALCAVAERLRWNQDPPANQEKWISPEHLEVPVENIVVASFGTGQPVTSKVDVKKATGWGAWEWVSPFRGVPLIDILFDGSSDTTNYILTQMLSNGNYFRFQPLLDKKSSIPVFEADEKQIIALQERIRNYCLEIENELTNLIETLTVSKTQVAEDKNDLASISSFSL